MVLGRFNLFSNVREGLRDFKLVITITHLVMN